MRNKTKEMPKGWKKDTLESICDLQAGKFISASKIFEINNDLSYPCYGGNGLRGYVECFSHNGIFSLIGRQGALCGNINKTSGKFYVTEHAIVVTPYKNFEVNWLYYQLIYENLNKYATGAAQPGLSVKNLKEIKIFFPPLPEQKAIADLLMVWDEAIERSEKLIKAKEKRFKWLLKKLINNEKKVGSCGKEEQEKRIPKNSSEWKKVKLGELFDKEIIIEKGKSLTKTKISEGEIPVVAGGQVYAYFHNKSTHEMSTITISASGAYAGFIWFHNYPIWASDCNVIFARKASIKFFYFALKLQQQIIYSLQSGGAQPHVYAKDLKNLEIFLPPLHIQEEIAETLTDAQDEIKILKNIVKKYKEQKKGLMQKLLTGIWRVKLNE